MDKKILKYKDKFCKCDKSHFEITKEGVKHKGVLFLRFKNDNERINLLNMMDSEIGIDFLNDKWNFYVALND